MTEGNAKTWIINAAQDFLDENDKEPTTVRISRSIALDLMKLGRNEIGGDLAEALFKDGIKALEGQKVFGYDIVVDPNEEDISCE